MSKTRTSHTPEERTIYWKERMVNLINSKKGEVDLDFINLISNVHHVKVEEEKIFLAVQHVRDSFKELYTAINEAQENKQEVTTTSIDTPQPPQKPYSGFVEATQTDEDIQVKLS